MNPPPETPQNSADPQLDRLLSHLAAAEPSADLNARLLRNLAQRQATAPARHPTSVPLFAGRKLWALLLVPAAVVALLLSLPLPSHRDHPGSLPNAATPKGEAAPTSAETRLTAGRGRAPARPGPTEEASSRTSVALASPNQARGSGTRTLTISSVPAQRSATSSEEAQALDDLHAPSQPAPPMPLTAEERLLTRVLRRDGQLQLAQIAQFGQFAPHRDQDASGDERAAFQRFFDPPPPPGSDDPSPSSSPTQGKPQ